MKHENEPNNQSSYDRIHGHESTKAICSTQPPVNLFDTGFLKIKYPQFHVEASYELKNNSI